MNPDDVIKNVLANFPPHSNIFKLSSKELDLLEITAGHTIARIASRVGATTPFDFDRAMLSTVIDATWLRMHEYLVTNASTQPDQCKTITGGNLHMNRFSLYSKNIWEIGEIVTVTYTKGFTCKGEIRARIIDKKSENLFVLCGLADQAMLRYTYSAYNGLRLIS